MDEKVIALKDALLRLLSKKEKPPLVIISDPGDEQQFYNITKKKDEK